MEYIVTLTDQKGRTWYLSEPDMDGLRYPCSSITGAEKFKSKEAAGHGVVCAMQTRELKQKYAAAIQEFV